MWAPMMLSSLAAAQGRAFVGVLRAVHGTAAQFVSPDKQLAADRRELLAFFPTLVEDVKADSQVVGIPSETEWIGKVLHYVVPRGRLFRGCSALNACRELLPPDRAALGRPLGLAFEMLQGYVVIIDDLVDAAELRRGLPAWHTLPGVGVHAVNDAFLVHTAMNKVLHRYFHTEPSYVRLFELFNEAIFYGIIAQNYECHNGCTGEGRFDAFDHAMHAAQARFKIAHYSFYSPLAAAMHLAGLSDSGRHGALWGVAQDIGMLFTVQDDYSDCYEPESLSGKTRCDIRNGKCTWLVVEAKRRANDKQRALLKENYGVDDAEKVAAVMELYAELGMEQAIQDWMRSEYSRISEVIRRQRDLPPDALHYILDAIRQPLLRVEEPLP
ncbi:farnesyl pyrophosphate synthase-like isoform X3 [Frankliniella occidentalis]|uniref:Farnesyl pyrophosphate synthase n=1 Tax=Frankliniella occidentalis TaxID=133901 RepID=A0A6J1S471_FRAOC|nr:farnesyl pyrophosphate synthase-like isoform X3 [Frankliniella occidentalis]